MSKIERKVRLDPEELDALRRKLPRPAVTADTSPLQAGYQLGVQQVLELLRDGWVIEQSD